MSPAVVQAVRAAIADWHREADGSRTQAEYHERLAAEHRADAERAAATAAELEAALAAEGVAP